MQIEFPPNFKVLLDSWNMKTNIWLRECIYKRVAIKGQRPGNRVTMITFLTSAFWVSCCLFFYPSVFDFLVIVAWYRIRILSHIFHGSPNHLRRTSSPYRLPSPLHLSIPLRLSQTHLRHPQHHRLDDYIKLHSSAFYNRDI